MALIGYTITVVAKQDNPYNVLPETDISIRKNSDNTLVNIYADEAGLIPIAQLGAKTDSNGQFTFYADASLGILKAVWTNGGVIATEVLDQNDHSRLVNLNADGAHDAIYSRGFDTIAEMIVYTGVQAGIVVTVDSVGGKYLVVSGVSSYPLVDPQSTVDSGLYFKLLPMEGANYSYSFLAAGADNKLTIPFSNSDIANQLLDKIMDESPVVGGTIYMSGGQYWFDKTVTRPNSKNITIKGELSTLTYNSFESKTIIYTDNSLVGDYVFDFELCQYTSIVDIGIRGDVSTSQTKGGIFIGKKGAPSVGYGNALIERVNVHGLGDGCLLQNGGISTIRDFQASNCRFRGLALETSGDSNLYNIYCNTNNKDTTDASVLSGTGLYIGRGSNNVNVFGGKLEFNSKGLVIAGSNGVTASIQYDYNHMANVIVRAENDNEMACRGITLGNSRILSGGVAAGYEKSSIYTDSTLGSVSVNITGGTLRAAGNGAFDNSTSGLIGPEVSIIANGNAVYDNQVSFDGDGIYMATVKNVICRGSKSKVTLGGLLPDDIGYDKVSGGQVITKQSFERTITPVFSGTSGTPTYTANTGNLHVADGVATVDIFIQLSGLGGITGDLILSGLTVASKTPLPTQLIVGITNNLAGSAQVLGYLDTGSSAIVMWKKSAGVLSRLNASDLQADSLIRCSISFKV